MCPFSILLHLVRNNPIHQYGLGADWLQRSFSEDFGILSEHLVVHEPATLFAAKKNNLRGYIKLISISIRSREVILPSSAQVRHIWSALSSTRLRRTRWAWTFGNSLEIGLGKSLLRGWRGLTQVAQRSCGCPLPGSLQGQVGWGFEKPGLVEGVPAHGRRLGTRWSIRSLPTQSILWFYDSPEKVQHKPTKFIKRVDCLIQGWESSDCSARRSEGSGASYSCINTWWEGIKKTEPGFSQWCPETEQKTMGKTEIQEIPLKHRN